ncbi:MAG: efflux RND transporter periplasmic adaptor subunit [Desulfobacteraceae bacterium]|nr:efflux RND transporter periplasmic adaptor subunit [Desulfobacteraceae bacterium]
MREHPLRWIIVLLVVAALASVIWKATRPKPVLVSVKPVTRGIVERTVANTRAGTVKACRRAKLSPSVGGQIARLPVKKGDRVKQGQVLLELWNKDLKARTALAENQLNSARSKSKAICLKAELAQRNARRVMNLRSSDVASEEQADNAVSEAKALKAECEAANAEIQVRKAQLAVARANVDRTQLKAPFDGVIAEINGELSEFVTPSPIGVPTPPAIDIVDNVCFYVAAPIDEVDAEAIRMDMTARITMDAFKNKVFQARVRRIADYVLDVEKQARTVEVEAAFAGNENFNHLLAGYSADIEVILDVRENVVRVPTEAVIKAGKVFKYLPDQGKLKACDVRTGLSNWNWTEVLNGLSPGDQVVVNVDNPDLADDAPAEIIEDEELL